MMKVENEMMTVERKMMEVGKMKSYHLDYTVGIIFFIVIILFIILAVT